MLRALNPKKFSLALIALFTCFFVYQNACNLLAVPLALHGQYQYASLFTRYLSSNTTNFFQRLEFDLQTKWQAKRFPNPNVAILDIDEKTLAELGQFPFPRYYYARLIERLKSQGVLAVGFDVLFAEEDRAGNNLEVLNWLERNRKQFALKDGLFKRLHQELVLVSGDQQFSDSLQRVGLPVTLGYAFEYDSNFTGGMAKKIINSLAYANLISRNQIEAKNIDVNEFTVADYGDYPVLPTDLLLRDNMNNPYLKLGCFNAVADTDSVLRKARLVTMASQNNDLFGSLAVSTTAQYLNSPWHLEKKDGLEFSNSLGMRIPMDSFGEIFLRFYGPSKTISTFSLYDAYAGNLGDKLRGKILFVGTSALGLKDLRSNPFSTSYPGVEMHGTLASNILNQEFITLGMSYYSLGFLLLIMGGILIGYSSHQFHPLVAGFIFLASSVALAILSHVSFDHGVMLPIALPCLEFFSLTIAGILFRYLQEEGEKKYIREAFSRYVSGSVVSELLRDRSKLRLGGEKRELTVLFCDLKGFTHFAETLDASLLSQILNQFFTSMTKLVLDHRGTLDKYMGDALMCFWGAPIVMDNHAEEACAAALEMCLAAEKISLEWKEKYGFAISVRIGVNTGIMSVGNMGSEQVFSYTTMGDQVNLGSRLEGVNNFYGTKILVGENSYTLSKHRFCFRKVDIVLVKGKDIAVSVYELIDLLENQGKHQALLDQYASAYQVYASGDWRLAQALFTEHLRMFPNDAPAAAILQRMKEFQFIAPKEFKGVWTLGSK